MIFRSAAWREKVEVQGRSLKVRGALGVAKQRGRNQGDSEGGARRGVGTSPSLDLSFLFLRVVCFSWAGIVYDRPVLITTTPRDTTYISPLRANNNCLAVPWNGLARADKCLVLVLLPVSEATRSPDTSDTCAQ